MPVLAYFGGGPVRVSLETDPDGDGAELVCIGIDGCDEVAKLKPAAAAELAAFMALAASAAAMGNAERRLRDRGAEA